MPTWRAVQSKRQIAKKTKLALTILALVLGLLILSQVVKLTKTIFSPWNITGSIKRNYLWNGDFNINFLLRSKAISLVSYSPKNQKITIIDIPDETYLDVSHGFGKWQLGSIYGLGGEVLLKDTLNSLFAIPIDGFLSFLDKFSKDSAADLIETFRKNPFSGLSVLSSLKTDLTPFELFRLKMGLMGVRFDKIKHINLESLGLLEKFKLADGTEVYLGDPLRLDSLSSDMIDPNLQSEHKTVAVFNSTDHPNLAQKAARLITNIGGDVIIISNGHSKLKSTQIVGEKSKTLVRLRQIFGEGGRIDSQDQDLVSSRAQINVFLGEDFALKL